MTDDYKYRNTNSADITPWKCEHCGYLHDDGPPKGFSCLRCKQVANIFEREKAEQAQKAALLDRLHQMVGCEYLSDLKSEQFRGQLIQSVNKIAVAEYPLMIWAATLSYLSGEDIEITSAEDLQFFLLEYTEETI